MKIRLTRSWLLGAVLLLAGCAGAGPIFVPVSYTPIPSDGSPLATPGAAVPPTETLQPPGPPALAYDLGDFSIPQPGNPEGDMPARLRGLLAWPEGAGRHPVAVILHEAGFGCPPADDTRTSWPCGEAEQPNWTGFSYLASALASRGYVALVPDINAQVEVAYGEAQGFERLAALTTAHLDRLARAATGEELGFGLDREGRADMGHIVLVGHGQGAAGSLALASPPAGADAMPVAALLLIAPEMQPHRLQNESPEAPTAPPAEFPPDAPIGVILPECDGIVNELTGARIYDAARLAENRQSLTAQVFLSGANHNAFSSFLEVDDGEVLAGARAGCEPEIRLDPEAQRRFLAQYAADFFDAVLGTPGAEAAADAAGLDPARPEPAFLYWQGALTSLAVPTGQRLRLLVPRSVAEVNANLLGGPSHIVPPAEVTFCPGDPSVKSLCTAGFHPPGGAPFPATLRLAWDGAGGLYQIELGTGATDLTSYTALSFRAAVDPTDPRSLPVLAGGDTAPPGTPAVEAQMTGAGEPVTYFTLVLRDAVGGAATVSLPAGPPALAFPVGEPGKGVDAPPWTGFTPLSSIRIPLSAFKGVDLSQTVELAFSFDGPDSGAIRLADLEFLAR